MYAKLPVINGSDKSDALPAVRIMVIELQNSHWADYKSLPKIEISCEESVMCARGRD